MQFELVEAIVTSFVLRWLALHNEDEATKEEEVRKFLAKVLDLLPISPLGKELFEAVAKKSVSVFMETIMLRENPDTARLEILLERRGPEEAYPNLLSLKGKIIWPNEPTARAPYLRTFGRLVRTEYGSELMTMELIDMIWVDEKRGPMLGLIFFVKPVGNVDFAKYGSWYPVDEQPADCVEYQWKTSIRRAVEEYRFRKKWQVRLLDYFAGLLGGRIVRRDAYQ